MPEGAGRTFHRRRVEDNPECAPAEGSAKKRSGVIAKLRKIVQAYGLRLLSPHAGRKGPPKMVLACDSSESALCGKRPSSRAFHRLERYEIRQGSGCEAPKPTDSSNASIAPCSMRSRGRPLLFPWWKHPCSNEHPHPGCRNTEKRPADTLHPVVNTVALEAR
jgi:hypothetical protein